MTAASMISISLSRCFVICMHCLEACNDPLRSLQVCLVIYAPRKGVCDVYATRHGPVLHSLQCGANCRCDDMTLQMQCLLLNACCFTA